MYSLKKDEITTMGLPTKIPMSTALTNDGKLTKYNTFETTVTVNEPGERDGQYNQGKATRYDQI